MKKLKYFCEGEYRESRTTRYVELYDPSTGEITAQSPCCTHEEVENAIAVAKAAYPGWSQTTAMKRAQVLFKVRELIEEHMEELTLLVATEQGKVLKEAEGDVLKAKEATELACNVTTLMMGESLSNTSMGFDTVLYREPIGVFAGIAPFNFPAMIPMGWMAPLCLACGNTLVIKASSTTPKTSLRIAELYKEAGLPDGVLNVVMCSRQEAEIFLTHPDIRGITFVGTTNVGKHIYSIGAMNGKRVQALCEAKNHALVLEDAPIERTAAGIINAAFGCAGERCMALPVVVAEESIADQLVTAIVDQAKNLRVGPAYHKESKLGPIVTASHKDGIIKWIETGISEGASLKLDGRNVTVAGYEGGFYLGPTIFDHVEPGMTIGDQEIFGPVLCIKRVKNFEQGIELMNENPYGNGSVIFTQNGYYAREFAQGTNAGMVGVNVGIPVPISVFPFSGHKDSFFGDLHCLGKDSIAFYTESKCITTRWFDECEMKNTNVTTWDGTI